MAYLNNLNLSDEQYVDDREGFELLPAGEYKAHIIKSSADTNKKETGIILTLEFDILEGQYKGRKIWDRLNIQHENSQAEEIGRRQLRKLVEILGLPLTLDDSEKLHFKPVIVVLKVEKRKDNGQDANRVSYYKSVNAATSAPTAVVAAPAEAPKAQPWKKKA